MRKSSYGIVDALGTWYYNELTKALHWEVAIINPVNMYVEKYHTLSPSRRLCSHVVVKMSPSLAHLMIPQKVLPPGFFEN